MVNYKKFRKLLLYKDEDLLYIFGVDEIFQKESYFKYKKLERFCYGYRLSSVNSHYFIKFYFGCFSSIYNISGRSPSVLRVIPACIFSRTDGPCYITAVNGLSVTNKEFYNYIDQFNVYYAINNNFYLSFDSFSETVKHIVRKNKIKEVSKFIKNELN